MLRGKSRWMGLGSLNDVAGLQGVSLAEAREAALAARRLVQAGQDPIDARRVAEAAAPPEATHTFKEIALAYISAHEAGWRNSKHKQQWRNTLATYAYPTLGELPVAGVTTEAVEEVLKPIWHTKPETASRLRGRIEAVLDYAKVRKWRTGENPATWRGNLKHTLADPAKVAKVKHHPALPWRQMGSFMGTLQAHDGVSALALRFVILTACRTGEGIAARWGEIMTDGPDGAIWTIPAERMKAGREHRVPLTDGALAILQEVAKLRTQKDDASAPVFPGQRTDKPLSNMALLMLLRRMERGDLTAHGFRSTFRDWVAEATDHPRELAEAALAHVLGNKVEAAYQRGDLLAKRRKLMEDWAAFCRPADASGTAVMLCA
jgi:integrase